MNTETKHMQSVTLKGWCLAVLLALSWTAPQAQNPQLQWAAMTSSAVHKNMQAMTVDSDGNTLVVIASFGTFNFAGSLIPHSTLLNIAFGPTLIKLDPSGNVLWHRSLRGLYQSSVNCGGIATDEDNNIYVTLAGYSNWENASSIGGLYVFSPQYSDHFLVKISPEGTGLWFKTVEYISSDGAVNSPLLTVAPDGCVFSCGYFHDTVNLDGIIFENQETGSLYLWKIDPDGNTLWAKKFTSPNGIISQASSMVVGNDGSVYITGQWEGDSLVMDNHVIYNELAFTGNSDRWISKIAPDGNTQWLIREHSAGSENRARLSFTPENHLLVLTYTDQEALQIGDIVVNGPGVALSQYSATGEVTSGLLLSNDLGPQLFFNPPAMVSNDDNSILISYEFAGSTLNFGGFEVSNTGGTTGTTDAFIAKINGAGDAQWIYTIGSEDSERANFIASVDADRFVVGGAFTGVELNIQGTALVPHTQYETEHFLASFSTVLNTRTAEALQQLLAYPNPFSESVQFDAEALQSFGNATLTVFNTSGVEVYRKQLKGHDTEQISLAHLPAGAYVARLSDGKRSLHTKLIKQ